MKKLLKLFVLSGLLCLPLFSQAQNPIVVISEVGWAGSSLGNSDEWLELTNLTPATVDLTGWGIVGSATSGQTLSLPENAQIAPASTYLIANFDHEDERSALAVPANYTTASLSLSNSSLGLILQNASGKTIDAAGDGGLPPAGGIIDVGTGDLAEKQYLSMVRIDSGLDGTLDSSWTAASQSIGFDSATADFGTPGVLNLAIPDPSIFDENEEAEEETGSQVQNTLIINEIVSDPAEGREEFVEIFNAGDQAVDLSGWSIQDATAKSTLLPEEELAAGAYYVIYSPRGILNNGGDTVELMNPDGAIIDVLEYGTDEIPAAPDPNALARDPSGQFVITGTPTPNAANVISDKQDPKPIINDPEPENNEPETENNEETPPASLIINEIVSDPAEGLEEFIEIFNPGTVAVSLAGWLVRDASLKATLLPEEELAPNGYYVVYKPKGILNNGGDTVELMNPDGAIIDVLEYGTDEIPAAPDPNALARDLSGQFVITGTPTPGAANVINALPETSDSSAADSPSSDEQSASTSNSIDEDSANEANSQNSTEESSNRQQTADYTLILSEIYPNTLGNDADEEFVEIQNIGSEYVDLQGIILEDESGKQYIQTEAYPLAPGAYHALLRAVTKITLNNDGDVIRLFTPDSSLLEEITYEKASQGFSYARQESDWAWTNQVTPNEPNRFAENEVHPESVQPAPSASVATATNSRTARTYQSVAAASNTSLAAAKELPDNARVILEGLVSVEPGILGKQIMYFQDSSAGLQIYKYDSQFPNLAVGDEVKIVGTMSTSHGERRVKITADGSITKIGAADEPRPIKIDGNEFDENHVGRLVSVTGLVLSRSGSLVLLESEEQEIQIRLASNTDIEASVFEKGATVKVSGLLTAYDGNYRLAPRSHEDIEIIKPAEEIVPPAAAGKTQANGQNQSLGALLAAITLLTIGFLALRQLIRRLKKPYADHPSVRQAASRAD